MKRGLRKLFALLLITCLTITGCGSKKEQKTEPADQSVPVAEAGGVWLAEDLELPQDMVISSESTFENSLYFIGYIQTEPEVTDLAIYRMDLSQEQPQEATIIHRFEQGSEERPVDLAMRADGNPVIMVNTYTDNAGETDENSAEGVNSTEGENSASQTLTDVSWKQLDQSGEIVASGSVMEYFDAAAGPAGLQVDGDGNLYFYQESQIVVVDESGALVADMPLETMIFGLLSDHKGAEGQVYAATIDLTTIQMGIAAIDPAGKTLLPAVELPAEEGYFAMAGGSDGNFVLASNRAISEYHSDTSEIKDNFLWAAINRAPSYSGRVLTLADGRILWVDTQQQGDSASSSVSVIRAASEEEAARMEAEAAARETLTLGGLSAFIDSSIRGAVVEFNKNHPDYQLEIREYGSDDVQAGLEQLNTDIIAGEAPDLMILPLGYSMESYVDKGLLTDLTDYLAGDDSINKDDLQENIIEAFKIDGKLYSFPVTYQLNTIMGPRSFLGDRTKWTFEEMVAAVEERLDESTVFEMPTQTGVLEFCLSGSGNELVKSEAAGAVLDRELLSQMLEFSEQFMPEAEFTNDLTDMEVLLNKMSSGQILLLNSLIMSPVTYTTFSGLFGEPINSVGYPTTGGSGNLIDSTMLFAINSKSAVKDIAWEFISSLLTEEVQTSPTMIFLPIMKSALEPAIELAMSDQNNGTTMGITISSMTEEVEAEFRALIEGADTLANMDIQIEDIIREEAGGYFDGSRSLADVVDVIENRVGTYLAEIN